MLHVSSQNRNQKTNGEAGFESNENMTNVANNLH